MKSDSLLLRDADGRVWLQTVVNGVQRASYVGPLSNHELERFSVERQIQVVDVVPGQWRAGGQSWRG